MGVVVLPKTLTAKTEAKAADVMADLNALVTAVNGKLDLENLAESIRNALLPTGSLIAVAMGSAPTGFLLCQGQEVSRTTYATLFSKIGTTFGAGNGTTTFNVPDLRGRVPVGVDEGAGRLSANNALGNAAGEQSHVLSVAEMPSHNHEPTIALFQNEGAANGLQGHRGGNGFPWDNIPAPENNKGGGGAHNNMQPYQCINWAIKI